MRIVYFDTETTGVKFDDDKIIEIALLICDNDVLVEEYNEIINIEEELPEKIIKLTGISDKMISEGVTPLSVAEKLETTLTPGSVWIAHNTQFDLLFLYNLLKEYYSEEHVQDLMSKVKWLDTLTIFKDRSKYPHRLENMVEHYNLNEVHFHRAIDDTHALKESVKALQNERDDLKEYINLFGYHPKYGVNGEKLPFITYLKQPYYNGNKLKSYKDILPKQLKEEE